MNETGLATAVLVLLYIWAVIQVLQLVRYRARVRPVWEIEMLDPYGYSGSIKYNGQPIFVHGFNLEVRVGTPSTLSLYCLPRDMHIRLNGAVLREDAMEVDGDDTTTS